MMKVPMKVDYGVRALVELAAHYGEGPVQTAEIAVRQSIPEAYLDQLLTTLHKFGFIRSRRGPMGGHSLARDPSEIHLGMIMLTLEGNTPVLDCLTEPNECTLSYTCAQRDVWRSVDDAVHDLLSATTVADLAYRQNHLAGRGMYQI
ncbi:MAG: Rrf2 family transcriptional regulator [Dehalococcoidia bacterium]|nr:Rrf2 family transcriptional regulator [Dehalococcoidia bacterium]